MNRSELVAQIRDKQSYLCVGLDTDLTKIPPHLLEREDPVFEFNKAIIDATAPFCVSYKINTAFYEAEGISGWMSMQRTLDYIPSDCFTIADAKRGDIGNTSTQYAKAFFEKMNFDAITVAPYMGEDSVKPFLQYPGKWSIVLALTSNQGAYDFQFLQTNSGYIFESVIEKVSSWGTPQNTMFVVGATKTSEFELVRKVAPQHFLLVPGVGAQGGSLEAVSKIGLLPDAGLLVNASRQIIYADNGLHFAEAAQEQARYTQEEMKRYLLAL
jgi:orotidine-5'-phosphate decarboxylase